MTAHWDTHPSVKGRSSIPHHIDRSETLTLPLPSRCNKNKDLSLFLWSCLRQVVVGWEFCVSVGTDISKTKEFGWA